MGIKIYGLSPYICDPNYRLGFNSSIQKKTPGIVNINVSKRIKTFKESVFRRENILNKFYINVLKIF